MFFKNLPESGFEPRTSGIGSDSSANWATITYLGSVIFKTKILQGLTVIALIWIAQYID